MTVLLLLINGLCQEFFSKTKKEQKEIYKRRMTSPVMNVDFTNANVNGESAQVLILASPLADAVMFIARETKGHQECAQHNCRYLIAA